MRWLALFPFMLLLLAGTVPTHADDDNADDTAVELRPLIIEGTAADAFESAADATGFTQVIETREAWRGYSDVGEQLERGVGIQVRHFGGREDFQTISIRGSTPNQVKILLDGVSLSRAQNDVVNLADIPLDAVERIDVYRGFTPVRFASSGAASVVNIVTRAGAAGEVGGSLSYGSFETAKVSLYGGERLGGGVANAFLTYRHTKGDFTYEDDTPDPVINPSGESVERTRDNNESDSVDMTLRWGAPLFETTKLTLTGNAYYKDEGTPGPASNPQPLASYEEARGVFSAALETEGGTRVTTDLTVLDETVRDPKDPGSDNPGLGRPPKQRNTTVALGSGLSQVLALGSFQVVEGGLETAYEYFEGNYSGTAESLPERAQERARLALALGDDAEIAALNTIVSPQLRWESVWNFFDGEALFPPVGDDDLPGKYEGSVDPRLGLRIEPVPELAIKGNIGTYFRPPSFGELFGDDGFTTANPSLDPETGINRDIGFVWRPVPPAPLSDLALEYAYFNNDIDDMIVFIASGNRIPRPQNVGSARVRGHELRAEVGGPAGTSLAANYTRQDAENRTPFPEVQGKEIPSLPADEVFARVAIDRTRWSLAYELDYRSAVYLDQANVLERSPAFTTHSLALQWRPFKRDFEISFEADNVTDEQVSDVVGFPVPGRAFYVTVSYAARLHEEP